MRLTFEVVSIQRHARTRHGDHGDENSEEVTVVLVPVHPGGNTDHPNRTVWEARTASGEVRLANLPVGQAASFELHHRYDVEIKEAP
jgi:hypothetical protein